MSNADLAYFAQARDDIRSLLSGKFRCVLDVGCGLGMVGAALVRDGLADEADGVELHPQAVAEARKRLREVYPVDLGREDTGLPKSHYDLVLCLDVLEHMQDPWAALDRIRGLMKKDGTLVVSLPNVRHFRVVLPLVLGGRWDYTDSGLLDRTHLRFFTRKTSIELVEGAGFEILRMASTTRRPGTKSWWLDLLTLGLFRDFLDFQHVILARPLRSDA